MLEHLRAESAVVLHRGDPSRFSDAERRLSYAVHGQLYVTLSWQD
jgi:hypothetical protein